MQEVQISMQEVKIISMQEVQLSMQEVKIISMQEVQISMQERIFSPGYNNGWRHRLDPSAY